MRPDEKVSKEKRGRRSHPMLSVIGWREWVALPDLGIGRIKAKVDTGARSSALHAFDVELFRQDGIEAVRFGVHPLQRDSRCTVMVETVLCDERKVRNPGGKLELRPVIETCVELLGRVWPIELTLTDRDEMGFRMLLGRQAVRRQFVVDPGRSFLGGKGRGSAPEDDKMRPLPGDQRRSR